MEKCSFIILHPLCFTKSQVGLERHESEFCVNVLVCVEKNKVEKFLVKATWMWAAVLTALSDTVIVFKVMYKHVRPIQHCIINVKTIR